MSAVVTLVLSKHCFSFKAIVRGPKIELPGTTSGAIRCLTATMLAGLFDN